jgi:biotin carboxyl carrier protein
VSEKIKFSEIGLENGVFETRLTRKFASRKLFERQDPGVIKAVIPGVIAEIMVKAGGAVAKSDTLLILEAMKMLNKIQAPIDGTVKIVRVKPGEKVAKGQVLIEIVSGSAVEEIRRRR